MSEQKYSRRDVNNIYVREQSIAFRHSNPLPRPVAQAVNKMYELRHQFYNIGFSKFFTKPDDVSALEGYMKATFDQFIALGETYPQFQEALDFDDRVLNVFDKIRYCGNKASKRNNKTLYRQEVERCHQLKDQMNEEILGIFERMDAQFGTMYTPSEQLRAGEEALGKDVKELMTLNMDNHINNIQMALISREDEDITTEDLKTLNVTLAKIEREEIDFIMETKTKNALKRTGLSNTAKEAIIGLSTDRHHFHSHGFPELFIHPDQEHDLVNRMLDNYVILKYEAQKSNGRQDFLKPSFDLDDYVEQLKWVANCAKEFNFEEPYLSDAITGFNQIREELDDKILEYLKVIDENCGVKIAPNKIHRATVDVENRTRSQICGALHREKLAMEARANLEPVNVKKNDDLEK